MKEQSEQRYIKEDGPQISGSISVSPENGSGKRVGKKVKSRVPIMPTITVGGAPKVSEHYVKCFKEGDAYKIDTDIYKIHDLYLSVREMIENAKNKGFSNDIIYKAFADALSDSNIE